MFVEADKDFAGKAESEWLIMCPFKINPPGKSP